MLWDPEEQRILPKKLLEVFVDPHIIPARFQALGKREAFQLLYSSGVPGYHREVGSGENYQICECDHHDQIDQNDDCGAEPTSNCLKNLK